MAKMKALIVLLICVNYSFSQRIHSYPDVYLDSILEPVDALKKNKSLKEVALKLKLAESNELLQYSLIAKWVVNNFYYSKTVIGAPLTATLKSRKAVCMHYALMVDSLSKYCGLETAYISGYASSNLKMELHAWNAVKIDGHFYLSDITWCDDEVGKRNKATDAMGRLYFLMEPDQFIITHFPLKRSHKHVRYSWSKFKKGPDYMSGIYDVYHAYFDAGNHLRQHCKRKNIEIEFINSLFTSQKGEITGLVLEVRKRNQKETEEGEMYDFEQILSGDGTRVKFKLFLAKEIRENKIGIVYLKYAKPDGQKVWRSIMQFYLD